MNFDNNKDTLEFSTGTKIYANRHIIGIGINPTNTDDFMAIFEGYDGGIRTDNLTKDEKIELATTMLMAWTKYLNKVQYE